MSFCCERENGPSFLVELWESVHALKVLLLMQIPRKRPVFFSCWPQRYCEKLPMSTSCLSNYQVCVYARARVCVCVMTFAMNAQLIADSREHFRVWICQLTNSHHIELSRERVDEVNIRTFRSACARVKIACVNSETVVDIEFANLQIHIILSCRVNVWMK